MSLYRMIITISNNASSYFSCTLCHDFYKIPLDKGCVIEISKYKRLIGAKILIKSPGKITIKTYSTCYKLIPSKHFPKIDDLLYKLLE